MGERKRSSRLLYRRQKVAVTLLDGDGYRVTQCGQFAVPGQDPKLVRGCDGSHGLTNLVRCGSVWTCPVCRFHIARQRGEEVQEALVSARDQAFHIAFVTLTAAHGPDDPLGSLWKAVRKAVTAMFGGRRGKAWRESIGYVGRITAHEVTVGESGWHPHAHLVIVSRQPVVAEDIWNLWQHTAERYGLTVSRDGQNVQHVGPDDTDAGTVARYVSKLAPASWTLAHEVTDPSGTKAGKAQRLAPFQLLDEVRATGDAELADRFREYAKASRGVSSLRWSPGLRDALGITRDELTDEEAANVQDQDVTDVYVFSPGEWTAVFLAGLRVELLEAADRDGVPGVRRIIRQAFAITASYRRRPPPIGRTAQA